MNAAKSGYIAEFETGYLQRAIRMEAYVVGGTDKGLRDSSKLGFAPGRLVKIITEAVSGKPLVTAAGSTSATSIGDATHIIAQSDDTIREMPEDYNYTERYSSMPNGICKNTGTYVPTTYTDVTGLKTISVYKIVNADDVKIIAV